MLNRFILWFLLDADSSTVDIRWAIKMIAIKLKLYKPDKYELECIEHNKRIKEERKRK